MRQGYMLLFEVNIAIKRNGDYVEKEGCDPLRTSFILMYDTGSWFGDYSCTREKGVTFLLTLVYIYIYIYIYISWLSDRNLDWRLSQPSFNSSFGNLDCLATLKSPDRTKQICLWMTIYIYIYIYIYTPLPL